MRTRIIMFAGALTLGAASFPSPSADAAQGPRRQASLCQANETPLFQCQAGNRMVAVCGGRQSGQSYAQYRFGRPGNVELAYPADRARGAQGLTYARAMYSGGGELQFRFAQSGHEYVVYSRTIRTGFTGGRNNPRFEDGVMVRRGGRVISNRACSGPVQADGEPERFLREGQLIEID